MSGEGTRNSKWLIYKLNEDREHPWYVQEPDDERGFSMGGWTFASFVEALEFVKAAL